MKVLLLYHAGASQSAKAIFEALSRSVDLTVAVPERLKVDSVYDPSGWLEFASSSTTSYRYLSLPLVDVNRYGLGYQRLALRQLLKRERPDVIHVLDEATSRALFQVAWERYGICRNARTLFYGFDNLPLQFRLHSRVKWSLTWSLISGGASASNDNIDCLRRAGFPPQWPIRRIFWGIDTNVFRPLGGKALRAELGLDFPHVVGFVGRLAPEKGLSVLIDAWHRLPSDVHIVFIGSGPWQSQLPANERIHIFDSMKQEELVRYLNCMDLLVLPSLTQPHWKEQYGRVIGEAMACGVPVVGSDSGAIPEVIGDAGLLAREGNVAELVAAIRTVLYDSSAAKLLVERGMARVSNQLSCASMARELVRLYSDVLGS